MQTVETYHVGMAEYTIKQVQLFRFATNLFLLQMNQEVYLDSAHIRPVMFN